MGAKISLIIEYIPHGQGSINYASTAATLSNQGNNISNPQTLNMPYAGGIKPFILGISKLGTIEQGGDGHIFWGDPSKGDEQKDNNGRQIGGYFGGYWGSYEHRSSENGDIIKPVAFRIFGRYINNLTIRFAEALGEYATELTIDDKNYINTAGDFVWSGDMIKIDTLYTIKFETGIYQGTMVVTRSGNINSPSSIAFTVINLLGFSSYHTATFAANVDIYTQTFNYPLYTSPNNYYFTENGLRELSDKYMDIVIKKWNKPNKQVKITSILVGLIIEYDRKYFQRGGRIIAGSRQTLDNTKPNYGTAPQHGSFQAIDKDGDFNELSQSGLLTDGLRCGVFMNAEQYIPGTNYEDYKTANKDKMLGNYRLSEVSFIGDNVSAELTDDILNWGTTHQGGIGDDVVNTAYTFFTRLQAMTPDKVNISQETIEYLQSFPIPDGYIPPSMLDVAWDVLNWATATRISKDVGGDIWITM